MAVLADMRTRFPEFVDEEDARVQMFLDDAELFMETPPKWLSFYDYAHQYHAAHFLSVAMHTESGDVSPMQIVERQEVDDVQVDFAEMEGVKPTMESYLSTAYGKEYWRVRRSLFAGPVGF